MLTAAVTIVAVVFIARHIAQLFFDLQNAVKDRKCVLNCWARGGYIWILYAGIVAVCLFGGFHPSVLTWVGCILVLFGCCIGFVSLLTLRTSYSFEICMRKDFRLVTGGIYRVLRHPMRVGLAIESLGIVLISQIPMLLLPWLGIVALQMVRTKHEERFLAAHLGDAYVSYCRKSGFRNVLRSNFLHACE